VNAAAMAEQAMMLLIKIFQLHHGNSSFMQNAFGFLANVCAHAAAGECVPKTNIVPVVLDIMKRTYVTDPNVLLRLLKALENIACSTQQVKDHMKTSDIIPAVTEVLTHYSSTREDIVKQCKAVIDAVNRTKLDLAPVGLVTLVKGTRKTAKELFGDDKRNEVELSKEHKHLLLAGAVLKVHGKSGDPKQLHVFVSSDLKYLCWKEGGAKKAADDCKIKVFKIRTVERGRCTDDLKRKKTFGGFYAKEELSLGVFTRDKILSFETNTEVDREKWHAAITALVAYLKQVKISNTKFGLVT
jgi:hypothetical protein